MPKPCPGKPCCGPICCCPQIPQTLTLTNAGYSGNPAPGLGNPFQTAFTTNFTWGPPPGGATKFWTLPGSVFSGCLSGFITLPNPGWYSPETTDIVSGNPSAGLWAVMQCQYTGLLIPSTALAIFSLRQLTQQVINNQTTFGCVHTTGLSTSDFMFVDSLAWGYSNICAGTCSPFALSGWTSFATAGTFSWTTMALTEASGNTNFVPLDASCCP